MTGIPNPTKANLLLIDDDGGIRFILAEMLEQLGFGVTPFPNAEVALEYLENGSASPDAILLDLTLPGMSGLEFLDQLEKRPALQTIPVILISGYILRSLPKGATAVLLKPIDIRDLEKVLEPLVGG